MSNFVQIIEATAAAVDKAKTIGVDSPSGKKLVRKMERGMRGYFRRIRTTFPMERLLHRYELSRRPDIQESVESDMLIVFEQWLEDADPLLQFVFFESIQEGNGNGFEGSMADWVETFGIDVPDDLDVKGMIPKSVIDTARESAAKNVKHVDDETIKRMSGVIADALDNNLTTAELAKVINETFDTMTDARSKLIAQTEMNTAINDGVKEANVAVGADEKEWLQTYAADKPRDEHIDNMGDGRIPISRPFSGDGSMDAGGGNNNPFNCHCTVLYFGATEEAVRAALGLAA